MATLEVRPARSRHPSRLRLRQQLMARRRKATSTRTTVHFVRSVLLGRLKRTTAPPRSRKTE
jgi:hypothetical protein